MSKIITIDFSVRRMPKDPRIPKDLIIEAEEEEEEGEDKESQGVATEDPSHSFTLAAMLCGAMIGIIPAVPFLFAAFY